MSKYMSDTQIDCLAITLTFIYIYMVGIKYILHFLKKFEIFYKSL